MIQSFGRLLMWIVMIVVFFVAPTIWFSWFVEDIKEQMALQYTTTFLEQVTSDGVLTKEEYVQYIDALASLERGYEVELIHTSYITQPQYEYQEEAKLQEYFKSRNQRKNVVIPKYPVILPDWKLEELVLQSETNASIFAVLTKDGFIPLPKEEQTDVVFYEAVLPKQECYLGEALVTVVRVEDNGMVYYIEADDVMATESGSKRVTLTYQGIPIPAYIDVTVYPRSYYCDKGHIMPLTKEKIAYWKEHGTYGNCENCYQIPEMITTNSVIITAVVGTEWKDLTIPFFVTYMDGHIEQISTENKELYTNYDNNYCGEQEVKVSYQGIVSECVTIQLQGQSCKECGTECKNRAFTEYQRFPFCDKCLSQTPFYFGELYTQKEQYYHNEIKDKLELQGVYVFQRGDYIEVIIKEINDKKRLLPFSVGDTIRTNGNQEDW